MTSKEMVDRDHARRVRHLARWVLAAFLITFLAARILVLMIMLRITPDLYFYAGGTHVHHLNYGIILLSLTGGALLFRRPGERHPTFLAVCYGVGLALTFDEFGMWLHLGGAYWQRASFDAVIVIAAILLLIAYAPSWDRLKAVHVTTGVAALVLLVVFGLLLGVSLRYADRRLGPRLMEIEQRAPQ
ncbi:MAG TPA: hypothetical protein VF669_16410 [Tepidisphaeraceae bacterium]|jgi:hypothetical protein